MDEWTRKMFEEAERLRKLFEQVDPMTSLGLSALQIQQIEQYRKLAEEMEKYRKLAEQLDPMKSLGVSASQMQQIEQYRKLAEQLDPFPYPGVERPVLMGEAPTLEEKNDYQSARVLLDRLADSIERWRKELPEGVQPGILAILQGGCRSMLNGSWMKAFTGFGLTVK